jgi:hypothetical protein
MSLEPKPNTLISSPESLNPKPCTYLSMTLEAGARDLIGGHAAQSRKVPEDAEIGERARCEDQLSIVVCVGRACHQGDRVSRAPNLRARMPGVRGYDEEERKRANGRLACRYRTAWGLAHRCRPCLSARGAPIAARVRFRNRLDE